MKVFEYKKFAESLISLRRLGGGYQKAAEKTIVLIHDLEAGGPEALRKFHVTNHGEARIKKSVKYDIGHGCRLVTVQDADFVFLVFAGNHDNTDTWLNKNRGLTIRVDERGRPIATFESVDIAKPDERLNREIGFQNKPLLSRLNEQLRDRLLDKLNPEQARKIEQAEISVGDDDIEAVTDDIVDQNLRSAVFDTLILLRADDIEGAGRRVHAYLGDLQPVAGATAPHKPLVDSSDFQHISVTSEHYRQLIEHFAKNADFKEWMLFMHPDQQQFVNANYAGPTKLSGVSGSGKTCVVVRRAAALAEKYPQEKILVLTLNRSLATLIETLVDKAALPNLRKRIDVLPFFELCQSFLNRFEPENAKLYDDVTWKSKEHIDEVWREYYRCEVNNYSARVLQRLHDSLIARGIDAENYIREEFDWIRSATTPNGRQAYLNMERTGRSYGLDDGFRRELLNGLRHWEEKMRFVGVTDYLGIANALCHHIDRIEPVYRTVLIDECQDFGTVDIQIIRRLVRQDENNIFLCGDAAQQVSSKHQNLGDAGVPVPGARSHKLVLNYRNSRDILELAYKILVDNLSEQMLDSKDFEILDPEFANFSGPAPLLLQADNLREEFYAAITYAHDEAKANPAAKICIAICGYSQHEVTAFAQRIDLPVLDGEADLERGQVFISDLENTKGFEFQCMIILNCASGVIPYPRSPEDERFRDLSRLYVAMTRARQQLVMSFCGSFSNYLAGQQDKFVESRWSDYLGELVVPKEFELPAKLDQLRTDSSTFDILEMTGEQYLYTEYALGCPPLLIGKLRSTVSGQRRTLNGVPVEWKTIGDALRDTRTHARSRQAFGPEGYRLFHERFEEGAVIRPKDIVGSVIANSDNAA